VLFVRSNNDDTEGCDSGGSDGGECGGDGVVVVGGDGKSDAS